MDGAQLAALQAQLAQNLSAATNCSIFGTVENMPMQCFFKVG